MSRSAPSQMPGVRKVLVIGGGIGGLAAGNALTHLGIEAKVFERAPELHEIGAAIGVQTNAIKALRSFGRAEAVLATGVPIEHYEYYSWRGKRLVRMPQGDIGRRLGAPNVVLHRAELQTALLEGLEPGVTQLGATYVGYEEHEDGVTAKFADGQEATGDLLLGADGLHSTVRKQLLGDTELRYSGWLAWRGIAKFSHSSFPVGIARQILGRGRTFGMWHLSGGRVYWVGTTRMAAGLPEPASGRKKLLLEWFGDGVEPMADLIETTDETAILRNEVFDRVPVERWSSDRVTLLGDAAHPTTPVTGQGGGQAIEDAAVLAKQLAATEGSDGRQISAAFRAYEAERVPRTTEITKEAWMISKMHHWTNPAVCGLRDISLRLQPERVWVKRMEHRLSSYRG